MYTARRGDGPRRVDHGTMTRAKTGQDSFVRFMREASPYLRAHRGQLFVVYLGGDAIAAPGFPALVQDLALLSGIGARLVVVHGARPQVEARLAAGGVPSTLMGDLRVTDAGALALVRQAVAETRHAVEAQFAHAMAGRPAGAEGLRVTSGNFVVARPVGIIDGVDLQFTGEVRKVDGEGLTAQLALSDVLLFSPLAHSPTGELFSLNALDLAVALATSLSASKLVLFTPQPEVEDIRGNPVGLLAAPALRAAIDVGRNGLPVHRAALRASEGGVQRVHLVSSERDGALLQELFTREGAGTLISAAPFDQLRGATIEDVGGILALIEPLESSGVLVKRSREKLEREIGCFDVMVRDDIAVACGAVYPYQEERMAELACIAVHPDYQRSGFGAVLLAALEQRARAAGMEAVFVLTTQTTHWFQEHGYEKRGIDDLPVARQALYNYQRRSLVLVKPLR